jgi:hypothetical protein
MKMDELKEVNKPEKRGEYQTKEHFIDLSKITTNDMYVYRDKKGDRRYYYYEFRIKKGEKKRFYGRTPEEVLRKLNVFYEQNRDIFSTVVSEEITFYELFDRYVKETLKYHTYKDCRRMMFLCKKEVRNSILDISVKDLDADMLSDFLEEMYQKYPFCAVEIMYDYISDAIKYANEVGMMQNFNLDRVVLPKEVLEPVVAHFLSETDLKKLMYLGMFDFGKEYLTTGAAVALAIITKNGVNDVKTLNGDALDIKNMTLTVKNRVCDIDPEGYEWVQIMVKEHLFSLDENSPLIPNIRGRHSSCASTVFYFKKMVQDALYRDDINTVGVLDSMANNAFKNGMSRAETSATYNKTEGFVSRLRSAHRKNSLFSEQATKHRDELYAAAKAHREAKIIPFDENVEFED